MTPCGHTKEQRPHWIQFSGFHTGMSIATPLLSKAAEPDGNEPSAYFKNADTGI